MAGKKFQSQASQGNTRPSAGNVSQGGRSQSISQSRQAAFDSPLLSDPSIETVNRLRRERAGLSQSDLQRIVANQQEQQRRQQQLNVQSFSLEQQQAKRQAEIKAQQLSKKNEKILQEFERLKTAEATYAYSNLSRQQKAQLISNINKKRQQLTDELRGNQRQQVNILGIATVRSRNIGIELDQRAQQTSSSKPKKGTTITSKPFAFTSSSLAPTPQKPQKILDDAFGTRNSKEAQGPVLFFGDTPKPKQPIKSKSDTDKFLEGLGAPFENIITETQDFGEALFGFAQGKDTFKPRSNEPGNFVGLTPKKQRPLKETAATQFFSGKVPDVRDPAILGSALSEIGLFVAPVAGAKIGPKISTLKTPSVKNTVKIPIPKITSTGRSSSIALDIFKQDIGLGNNIKSTKVSLGRGLGRSPSKGGFSSTIIDLGRGTGKPPGTSDFTKGVFGNTKSRKISTMDDIMKNINKDTEGGKIITDKSGLQQILKTEQKTVKKAKTTQKTIQKQESLTDQLNREYFENISKSAKKRQRQSFLNVEQIAVAAIVPTRPAQKKKQNRKNTIPILAVTNQIKEQNSSVKQIPFVGFKQPTKQRQRIDTTFPTTTKQKFETIFPGQTINDQLFQNPVTTTTQRPPPENNRRLIGGIPFKNLFDGFGFDYNNGRKQKLKKKFDLNTIVSTDQPFSSAPNEFGFGIISTRTNSQLESLDKQFVKASKKKSKREFGTFEIFGETLLDVRSKKGKKNKKNNGIFDFDFGF